MALGNNEKTAFKIGGALLGIGAICASASYLTAKYLVKVAIDREYPPEMKRIRKYISGSEKDVDYISYVSAEAEKLASKETEQVEILSEDGKKLVGHYYPCDDPKRIIIAMHGWRSSWEKDFGIFADFWHEHGCGVLFAEQRSQGNSEGEYITFGIMERYDCLSWANWVSERNPNSLPVYLLGDSMGAATVLMASDLALPDCVHGIIADCGFTSVHDIWAHVVNDNLHLPYSAFKKMASRMFGRSIGEKSCDHSTVDSLKNSKVPVIFIHGTGDNFVPIEASYKNYLACASPKRILIVPGADHCMSYYVEKEKYEDAILSFWKDFD